MWKLEEGTEGKAEVVKKKKKSGKKLGCDEYISVKFSFKFIESLSFQLH